MEKGSFTFVLHSHLPYVVGHGKWPHGMDWLNEATAETYIPLLNVFNKLVKKNISPKVTIGFSPILIEQLKSDYFKKDFINYLQKKSEAAEKDYYYFKKSDKTIMVKQAKFWQKFYADILHDFREKYRKDIINGFKKLQDDKHIEIITCAATHGYLPLLGEDTSVQAQIKQAVKTYKENFAKQPKGIWLPECAYRPSYKWSPPVGETGKKIERKGVEEFLSENHIKYFIIDTHMLKGGKTLGVYIKRFKALSELWKQFETEYKPLKEEKNKSPYHVYLVHSNDARTINEPVAVFTRDSETGIQVWSGEHGYPGDGNYLDFHKKHYPGGHRYWKVTDSKADLADKQLYSIDSVEERLNQNAAHFGELVSKIIKNNMNNTTPPFVCSPFDTELFGHWWFEGPQWMYKVLNLLHHNPNVELTTCGEYLHKVKPEKVISIPEGSWGQGGFHWIWLNDNTKWTWKYIYKDEAKMKKLARKYCHHTDMIIQDILKQLARELLLLESSDWQFLISTWSARDYAELRVENHHDNFERLVDILNYYINNNKIDDNDRKFIENIKKTDNIFQSINPEWWVIDK